MVTATHVLDPGWSFSDRTTLSSRLLDFVLEHEVEPVPELDLLELDLPA